MEHKGTVVLDTERLTLRPFTENDSCYSFDNWTSDKKVTEFLRWPTHRNLDITKRILSEWIEHYNDKSFYQWAIVLKEVNEPIGTISVVDMDEKTNKVHIGYCIGSKWWHQGYTSEAFAALIPFFFNHVKVGRIESQHDPNNPNSGKVMQKCGLKYEGTVRPQPCDFSNRSCLIVFVLFLSFCTSHNSFNRESGMSPVHSFSRHITGVSLHCPYYAILDLFYDTHMVGLPVL